MHLVNRIHDDGAYYVTTNQGIAEHQNVKLISCDKFGLFIKNLGKHHIIMQLEWYFAIPESPGVPVWYIG